VIEVLYRFQPMPKISFTTMTLISLECIHGIPTPHASLYVARSILPVFLRMGVWVFVAAITTTCGFERGGATKPIIGSSWNNGVKNCLDLYQVQKRPNLILLIVFFVDYDVCKCLSDPAWSILQYFFANTHTQTRRHCFTPAVHARVE